MLTAYAAAMIRSSRVERPLRPSEETRRRHRHFVFVGIW